MLLQKNAPLELLNSASLILGISLFSLICLLFAILGISTGIMRLALLSQTTKFSYAVGADLSAKIFSNTLYKPYAFHIEKNSSEIISGITVKSNAIIGSAILPSLNLISSFFLFSAVVLSLIIISPKIAFVTIFSFGIIYTIIIASIKKRLRFNSKLISVESSNVIKYIQESLGGIRDIIIDNQQDAFTHLYRQSELPLRKAQGENQFFSLFPRYAIEAASIAFIALTAFILSNLNENLSSYLPVLGALLIGAQRLLPIIQGGYASWTNIIGGNESVKDALILLKPPVNTVTQRTSFDKNLNTIENIVFEDISFKYPHAKAYTINNLSLKIAGGNLIGIIGSTGAGKSTFLDITLGLLQPTSGSIKVNGYCLKDDILSSWHNSLAHVPQHIYLADSSIVENITFSCSTRLIDMTRLWRAIEYAQLSDFINSLPDGIHTRVGERGVQLSGGQRQRIGIARALYKNASILILDEATSSLDNTTEALIMDSLKKISESCTILVVTHRLTTLKNCNAIYKLSNGKLSDAIRYESIINN
jgi:ATP-binding cassette subfamily B protein